MPPRFVLTLAGIIALFVSCCATHAVAQQPAGPPVQRRQVQVPRQQPQGPARQPQRAARVPGQPVAGQPPVAPRAPFQLTPQETADLDLVLREWELKSDKVKTLTSEFTRFEFDPVFKTNKQTKGILKFKKPDKGVYQILDEGGEHWICDGLSIYEYNHQQKLVIERRLPPELQGKAIVDGPLPFIFGAKAAKLKARYFMRLARAPNEQERQRRIQAGEIWIEAYPRHQRDAANFSRADLILSRSTMLPKALRIRLPGGNKTTDHIFTEPNTNGIWDFVKDIKPSIPFGWKLVQAEPQQQPARPPRAAQRPAGPPLAK